MAPNRLILDTDGGVDDAQALLLLIAAGRAPHAVTTTFGNVSLEAATRNVLATLAVAGAAAPVHAGAAQPLAQDWIHAIMSMARMGWAARRVPPGPPRSPDRTPSDSWSRRCRPRRRAPIASIS